MQGRILGLILIIISFSIWGGSFNPRYKKHNYVPDHARSQNAQILARNEKRVIGGQAFGPDIESSAHYPDLLQYFYGSNNQSLLDIGIYNHHPAEDFYHGNGKLAVQLATYNDEVRANEEGLPLAGLSDDKGNLRLLFRLDGGDESPLILMKDTNGRNRLIMGLDINGGESEPFLVQYDAQNTKSVFFGNPASPGNPNQ